MLEKFSSTVTLSPGLSEKEIALFQTELPGVIPREIRELLVYSAGFDVDSGQLLKSRRMNGPTPVHFTGSGDFGLPKVLPCSIVLLGDGFGNFWVVDVDPSGGWGAILFVCHDPPVVAIQAADLACFLGQVLNPGGSDSKDTLDFVRNAATTRIWKDHPWLVSVKDARLAQDAVVSTFASQLPDNFDIVDLRSKEIGSGFSWGLAGPNTEVRRSGAELLFGVEPKAPSFLRRILTRTTH
jgi:cell wall assembly regulator SMI1